MNKQTNQISFKDEAYFFFGKAEQAPMKMTCLNDPASWDLNNDIDIEAHFESIVKRNENE